MAATIANAKQQVTPALFGLMDRAERERLHGDVGIVIQFRDGVPTGTARKVYEEVIRFQEHTKS